MSINLNSLLEYQKLDIQLRKLTDEVERNEDNKKLEQAKSEFNAAKIMVTESEKAAESIISFYNNALNYYDENNKKIEEIAENLNLCDNEDERKELVLELETLKEKFAEIERRLAERREKSEKVIRAYLDAQERGKKMREIYNNVKLRLESFKKEKEPQIKTISQQLGEMSKNIQSDVLKQYKALTDEKKYPAFVEAILTDDKKNYRCFCGLTLSQKTKSELMERGLCQCETCRRIIYKT